MPEYRFTIVVTGCDRLTDAVIGALNECGCDDCTCAMRAGQLTLDFCRHASDMGAAVASAIRDVQRAEVGRLMSVYLEGWQGLRSVKRPWAKPETTGEPA